MKKVVRPSRPRELWSSLTHLFPTFAEDCTSDDLAEAERHETETFHLVMLPFTQYFGGHHQSFSVSQFEALGSLINDAVTTDDDLENAVSTCFLEHLHQIRSYKVLAPYLSAQAKRKTHA